MNKKIQISEEEKRAIVNYLSDKSSSEDLNTLNRWLEKSEDNKFLFDQFSDIWQASYFKKTNSQIDVNKAWRDLQSQINRRKKKSILPGWNEFIRIAAVFIVAIFIGGLGYYFLDKNRKNRSDLLYVEYVSPLGSRSFVHLADGSKVWLNAGSTLKYKNSYGVDNRELILTGEAFFEVEKNKDIPFIVKTSEIDVIAIGTKFNVKAYTEENTIETTLIEGSVKLESSSVKLQKNLFLKPYEKAIFTKKNQSTKLVQQDDDDDKESETIVQTAKPMLEVITSVEPEPIISWKEKRWIIKNEKLGDLAIKLERRFDVNLIFDNEMLKEYSFGGTLEDETLEQVLDAIKFTSPIKYVIDKKDVYIKADGKKMEKFKNLLMD